jgi:molybdate-binding protein
MITLRPEVAQFAEAMEDKLRLKDADFPNGWKHDAPRDLFKRLLEKVDELDEAMQDFSKGNFSVDDVARRVVVEAADVANFAMMIADKARQHASIVNRLKAGEITTKEALAEIG